MIKLRTPQPLPVPTTNALLLLDSESVADRLSFLHVTCFAPATSTRCKDVDAGFFTTWPGLIFNLVRNLVRKCLPKSVITAKGHLDQQRANLKTTKSQHNDAIV
jgi:hypothetical protein